MSLKAKLEEATKWHNIMQEKKFPAIAGIHNHCSMNFPELSVDDICSSVANNFCFMVNLFCSIIFLIVTRVTLERKIINFSVHPKSHTFEFIWFGGG